VKGIRNMYLMSFFVLKGQFILAQRQRLGIKFMELLVGLKVQLNFKLPLQVEKQIFPNLLPKTTLRFAVGLN